MKRVLSAFFLVCFLVGCQAAPADTDIRAQYDALNRAAFHFKIFSDTNTFSLEYEGDYVYNRNDSDTLTLTAPESIAGLQATIAGSEKPEFTLQYETTILESSGPSSAGLTPADCIPYLLYELRTAEPVNTVSESANGTALLALQYEDAAQESGIIRRIWLDAETHYPVCAEIYADGSRILQCIFSAWQEE